VDGDQSTSDMAVAFSSRRKPAVPRREFRRALLEVCRALAEDIVRNGEGVAHVIRVVLRGFAEPLALGLGKAVVNSPLVKTAVFGNDPNVGRIVAALGDHLSAAPGAEGLKIEQLTVRLGGIPLYEGGAFRLSPVKERALASYLRRCAMDPSLKGFPPHERRVQIEVERSGRSGGPEVEVLGADLSGEYVRENADYRS